MGRAGDPDQAALEALAAFAPVFADPDCRFATWSDAGSTADPDSIRLSYVELTEVAERFLVACAEHGWVSPEIDWATWTATPEARRLRDDPDALASATSDDLAHLLTALVRGDRFYEGQLLDAFESGLLRRIAEQAARLAEDGRGRPDA
jgi:hypothetical protein